MPDITWYTHRSRGRSSHARNVPVDAATQWTVDADRGFSSVAAAAAGENSAWKPQELSRSCIVSRIPILEHNELALYNGGSDHLVIAPSQVR